MTWPQQVPFFICMTMQQAISLPLSMRSLFLCAIFLNLLLLPFATTDGTVTAYLGSGDAQDQDDAHLTAQGEDVLPVSPVFADDPTVRARLSRPDPQAPEGASSLAFVFDVTGSMYDDLVQVRDGAKRIFETVLEQRQQLIYNYVLVPFHDPEVGPIVVTTDTQYFQRKLQNLYVQGGGDCPEMAISGIKLALESTLPASFIYVFTDARAKDYHLTPQVLNLIQEKQSQVVFVMTGDCGNRTHPGYTAFEKIASTSNGQIFHLEKSDVNQVLQFVQHSVEMRKVSIEAFERENGGSFLTPIPVDERLFELTISVTGDDPEIALIDPSGQVVDSSSQGVKEVLLLPEGRVITIKKPKAGIWQMRTTTKTKQAVRVTGIGDIDFTHGFSAKITDINKAHKRPLTGVMSYVLINMTGLNPPGVCHKVMFVEPTGDILYEAPLQMSKDNPYLYYAGPLISPKGYYHIKVLGVDSNNYEFQRISASAVSNETAGGPSAYMAAKSVGFRGKSTELKCDITSRAPYTVNWYKDGQQIGGPLFFKFSDTAVWEIPVVDNNAVGIYECVVTSVPGNANASTELETREAPPDIITVKNVTVSVRETAYLTCRTQSQGRFAIQWRKAEAPILRSRNIIEYTNGTLKIIDVAKADEGMYHCIISNQAGTNTADVYLRVLDPPLVEVSPEQSFFTEGGGLNFTCIVEGNPKPAVDWYHNGNLIRPGARHYISNTHDLIIRQALPQDAGEYECRAMNPAGTGKKTAVARLAVPPRITVTRSREMIGRGDMVTLECLVTVGTPTPTIKWFRDGREISAFRYVSIEGGRLTIQGAQETDGGRYTCTAENLAGQAEGHITVDVGSIPSIVPGPDTVSVPIERDVTLQCRTTGHPEPEITWQKDGVPVHSGGRFQVLPDGSLLIRNALLNDGGRFTCTASNRFGRQDAARTVIVTGLVAPVLGRVSPEEQVVEGQSLRLQCIVVLGTPRPTLSWFYEGRPLQSNGNIMLQNDGSTLIVRQIGANDEGRYTCVATNAAGNATINVQASVMGRPTIEPDNTEYRINQGERLEMPCRVHGRPQPSIAWSKDDRPILVSTPTTQMQPDGSLVIYRVVTGDVGMYRCTASNAAGTATRTVRVIVQIAPTIRPDELVYNVRENDQLSMSCIASGDPTPQLLWYHLGRPVLADTRTIFGADGTLTIKTAREADKGEYRCVAQNAVGIAERVVTVKVHTSPRIEGDSKTIIKVVNQTVILECKARAEPPPSRKWYHEGRPVYTYGSELRFTGDGSLEIMKVQLKHAGQYSCQVSNLAGNDSITYNLIVQSPPQIISDIPGTIDVVFGLKLEIPCKAIGTPTPTITWKKDNLLISPGSEYTVDAEGTIRIDKTSMAHAGDYECLARNMAGTDQRLTRVVVQELPRILPGTPTEVTAIENDRTELRCLAEGIPKPEIVWYRGGKELSHSASVQVYPDGRLVILRVSKDDHGPYECRAINPAGQAVHPILLTVIVKPEIIAPDKVHNETAQVGAAFSLYCPVLSSPIPEITWQLNNRPIVESDPNIELSKDKRRLHILKARVTDAGVYKCIARNPAGESEKTFVVEVTVPPYLDESKFKRKVSVILNQTVTLWCPVQGTPEPGISWLANGQLMRPGESVRGVHLAEDSKSITIRSAQRDHQGPYTCVATNKAGTLDIDVELTVLTPPEPGDDEVIEILEGQAVTMHCDSRDDILKSTVSWTKDGTDAVRSEDNIQVLMGGQRLLVRQGKLSNTGSYVCTMRNSAGEARKTFRLTVLIPPRFRDKEFQQNIQIAERSTLTLTCHVIGSPFPEIRWEKDGQPLTASALERLQFTEQGQVLSISEVQNGAHYTCMAQNKAGAISRDFFVQTILAPDFGNQEQRVVIRVQKGDSAALDCPVGGSPQQLNIEWMKDGRPIAALNLPNLQLSLDHGRLHLLSAQETDEALYSCVAKNAAGQARRDFQLIVIVPPSISGRLVEDIEKIEGEPLTLRCEFDATPLPRISWTKEGARLPAHAQVLSDNSTVYINNVRKTDEGRFFCVVSNEAGRAEKTFNLKVLQKPAIANGDQEETREVIINNAISLDCPVVQGINVEFEWLRHDQPIRPGDTSAQILAGGRHLHLVSAQRGDAGSYQCIVRNKAGIANKRYKLIVLIPPTIKGAQLEYTVVLNGTVTLTCEAEGVPTPTLSWTKEGRNASDLPNIQMLASGQQYRIVQAMQLHDGQYICTATNKAGTADVAVDVNVVSPPSLNLLNIKDEIIVIQGQTADFSCPITEGTQIESVVWYRENDLIDSARRDKFKIGQRGRKMNLLNAQPQDEGSYGCVVKNSAGQSSVKFRLIVLVPPAMLMLDSEKNRTAVENTTVVFSCPASGSPDPTITWFKEGERLNSHTVGSVIPGGSINANQLRISRVRVDDSGRYTCTANNTAGSAEQDITLYVMTPPRIEREGIPGQIDAIMGQRATISCPAYGRPRPEITWLKNGRPMDMREHDENAYVTGGGQKLHFVRISEDDLAQYMCIARNQAGEDKRDFSLQVLVGPSLTDSNIPTNIYITVGRSTVLQCPVTGSPQPTIAWLKNGQPIEESATLRTLANGRQLQISNAQLTDGARYTCIASNPIGVIDLDMFVEVFGPPVVEGTPTELIEVVESQGQVLDCKIKGTPPMTMEWRINGQRVDPTRLAGYMHISSQGKRLHILATQISDEGIYTCVASNKAGEASKTYDLRVLVPPTINDTTSSPTQTSTSKNNDLSINCHASGKPQPQIFWKKDGQPIENVLATETNVHLSYDNQTLMFRRLTDAQAGRYTCHAQNKVGVAERDFMVVLKAPPQVDQGTITKEVLVGDVVLLTCQASGGSMEDLRISWLVDGQPPNPRTLGPSVTIVSDRVEIREARLSDAARYTCVLQNDAGEARKNIDLIVSEPPRFVDTVNLTPFIVLKKPLVLDCQATGTPKPTVTWYKDSAELNEQSGTFFNDKQQFRVESAEASHEGRYTCVASNRAGRAEKVMVVQILPPPQITPLRTVIEVAENDTTTLDCPVNIEKVEVRWTKHGSPVATSASLQVAGNGRKLHIIRAQTSDAGTYTCTARNEAGEAELPIRVIVLVPPRIIGETFRTLESRVNQTVDLQCRATGVPEPTIEWTKDGRPLVTASNLLIQQNGTMFRISTVQKADEGRYTCTASNKVGRAEADTFLSVLVPPTIEAVSDEKVILGQSKTIECLITGNPRPKVTWLKNNQPLSSAYTHVSGKQYRVHIMDAGTADAGGYTCVANNKAGESRHTINLEVLVAPTIDVSERVWNIIENTSQTLDCKASGTPTPQIVWFKNGQPINVGDSTYRIAGNKLTIISAKQNDAARYTCEATNEAGSADVDFMVDVYMKPQFYSGEKNIRAIEGQPATFECNVEAKPVAEITWLRGGRPINTGLKNYILSPKGDRLMILHTERGDAGDYTCMARNKAGQGDITFSLTVLVAPYLTKQVDQNPRVIVGQSTLVECPVGGIPTPTVSWLKDGNPVQLVPARIEKEGDNLRISGAMEVDQGRYTCHAENEAGTLDTDYALQILGPPVFSGAGGTPKVYEVVVGGTITMHCDVQASPKPEITWKKGEHALYLESNIWVSGDAKQVTISQARLTDEGKYTCVASNMAGTGEQDMILNVLVPPTIDKSNIIGNPLAIVNKTITLECPATGKPNPTVQWFKDGQPLTRRDPRITYAYDNQTLKIDMVREADKGRFTCRAENKAGSAEQDFNLEILIPPQLERSGRLNITVNEGESFSLNCPVINLNTNPDVSWTKEGRPLDPLTLPHMRFSSENRRLHVVSSKLADTGVYKCTASNRAGESSMEFFVDVLSPPTIDGSQNDVQPYVIQGHTKVLWCMVKGHPFPTVRWLKDGDVLTPQQLRDEYSLEDENQGLHVLNAEPKHQGRYTCVAENSVGRKELDILLDVWVPPKVEITGPESVTAGDPVSLQCRASGNPKPVLQWTRNNQPIVATVNGPRVASNGDRLDIARMNEGDVGKFTCRAHNDAGHAEASINLDVLVPPKIRRDGVEVSPTVAKAKAVTLECDATGKPKPTLSWMKQGTILAPSERYRILENGKFLQIIGVDESDEGIIKCQAKNVAGQDELDFALQLVDRPTIGPGGTVQVIEGQEALLVCDASGSPIPSITWQRNAQSITTRDRFTVSDKQLRIMNTRSRDAGIYVCVATNDVDTAQQAYTLEVLVPPKITGGGPDSIVVPVGQPFTLKCSTTGYPEPMRTWNKDSVPVQADARHSIDAEANLLVDRSQLGDSGSYTCHATNSAGTAEKTYQVQVIEPPRGPEGDLVIVNVTQGSPAVLACGIQATPRPEISWSKAKAPLSLTDSMRFEDDKDRLRIDNSRLLDAGDYMCIAQNPAGNATRRFQLNVFVPPTINEDPRRVEVAEGAKAELPCEALGHPKPEITWAQYDHPITDARRQGSSLVFRKAEAKDAAVYTCTAKNWAGSTHKDIELIVLKRPQIHPERMNVTVKENETATLNCNATGSPDPTVEWYKEPNILITRGDTKYRFIGDDLQILNVKKTDDAHYRCVATNVAGVGVGHRKVNVDVPQPIKIVWVECESYVKPRGDVPAETDQLLPWRNEFPGLPENGTNGVIVKCLPTREQRRALGRNQAPTLIELPQSKVLYEGDALILSCGAVGIPSPEILWLHNASLIPQQPPTIRGRSELRINRAHQYHAGAYLCLARNDFGSQRAPATVRVHPPFRPYQTEGARAAHAQEVALLKCNMVGAEPSKIRWMKHGRMLEDDDFRQGHLLLKDGTLLLTNFNKDDVNKYQCVHGVKYGNVEVREKMMEEEEPDVDVAPSTAVVRRGSTITFTCRHSSNLLTTQVTWYRHGSPVQETKHMSVDADNTLTLRNVTEEDAGAYACVVRNTAAAAEQQVMLTLLDSGVYGEFSGWSTCNRTCAPAYRQRARKCQDRITGRGLPDFVCQGDPVEFQECSGLAPCDDNTPGHVTGHVSGQLNGVHIVATPIWGDVTPLGNGNQINIRIESLPLEVNPVGRALLGIFTTPCWTLASSKTGAVNGYAITGGQYVQQSQYDFDTGENLRVQQVSRGMNDEGYLVLDVLVDGNVPSFPQQKIVRMQPFTENFVQLNNGRLHGYGAGSLEVGSSYRIPMKWSHNVSYEQSDARLPQPAQQLRISDIDLITENSFASKNFGYKFVSSAENQEECPHGFTPDETRQFCKDLNECEILPNICMHTCVNVEGAFYCACKPGWRLGLSDRYSCVDVDECTEQTHTCRTAQDCENTLGSFRCTGHCPAGYAMKDNGTCEDINECVMGLATCNSGEDCINEPPGSYRCTAICQHGYRRRHDGVCIDVDECLELIPCHPDQQCRNTQGGFYCLCPPGYISMGFDQPCQDVDECASAVAPCSFGCHNLPGSYYCFCAAGYEPQDDGKTCKAVTLENQMQYSHVGSPGFLPPGFGCPAGYHWTNTNHTCEDVNECAAFDPCQFKCDNTEGSYRCTCPDGYRVSADQHTCIDIDECKEGTAQCGLSELCFNQRGTYQCLPQPCPTDYHLEPRSTSCRLSCSTNGSCSQTSAQRLASGSRIQVQLVALPRNIPAFRDILRLTAYDQFGRLLRRTRFALISKAGQIEAPFGMRLDAGRGILYSTAALDDTRTYQLHVKAESHNDRNPHVKYETEFLIFVAVSAYPF